MSDTATNGIPYVRGAMLPQSEPPGLQTGPIRWLRDNLFAGPLNTVLTLIGIAVIVWGIKAALPWWLHGVWTANSLTECRAIIAGNWGPDATGACWALIHARWNQFIFGFYPQDQYWRPILAFILLMASIAPVLFPRVPRAALWLTAVYPALGYWLLWGGSVWPPVMSLAGFVLLPVGYWLLGARLGEAMSVITGFLAACVWWLVLQGHVTGALASMVPLALPAVDSDQFGGFLLAFAIGVTAIVASLPLGILLALGRKSDMLLVRSLCVGFIEFVRGVPLITMLFTASLLLQYFLPRGTQFDLILRVDILVTLFSAAYIAEVIRGGLAALPRGQYEAADALGLDYWQAQRLIIMPQALKISIPGIVSSFIGLFKDTTLVALVGLMDPLQGVTKIVRSDTAWKGIYWEPYIFVGAIFFTVCFSMSRYSMYLERKLKTDHR